MTYLVTGSGGYLGTALVKELRRRGDTVNEMRLPHGDVTKVEHWQASLAGVDIVFHLAAHESVNAAPDDLSADWAINAGSILNLERACNLSGHRPRVVFASSSNLVGCPASNPITEATPDDPLTIYAVHKRTAEDYLRLTELRSVTLRLPNIYGAIGDRRLEQRSTINRMIARALSGLALMTFRNEDCVRDFMHVDDAVSAVLAAVDTAASRSSKFVVGTGEGIRIGDAVRLIALAVGRLGRAVAVDRDPTRALANAEMRNLVVDSSAFRAATGWSPKTDFFAGIHRTVAEMSEGAS